jgi:hypothetical protein
MLRCEQSQIPERGPYARKNVAQRGGIGWRFRQGVDYIENAAKTRFRALVVWVDVIGGRCHAGPLLLTIADRRSDGVGQF